MKNLLKSKSTFFVRQYVYWCMGLLLLSAPLNALGPLTAFFNEEWNTPQSFSKQVEKNIDDLQKQKMNVGVSQDATKAALEQTQKSISSLKERTQRVRSTELDYVNQQLGIANKMAQVLAELVQVYQALKDTLDAHIKLLQEYKEDPEFKQKGLQPEQKSIYSIDDYQKISTMTLTQENELKNLEERLKKITADNETLKKNLELARHEYADKKERAKNTQNKRYSGRKTRTQKNDAQATR